MDAEDERLAFAASVEIAAAIRYAIRCELRNLIMANTARENEILEAQNAWWSLCEKMTQARLNSRKL
jgi:hypothetical protein